MAGANPRTVGVIGYGAIGRAVARAIAADEVPNTALGAILIRDPGKHRKCADREVMTDDPDVFFEVAPDLVVEAAGQEALRRYADRALDAGADLLITSIGAFSDDAFFEALLGRANRSGARILLASGALPAVDWMSAASLSGGVRASITQAKPVSSWRGTPADGLADLDALTTATCFFEGSAREAASRFPKSSNITAMVALCTAGLDDTRVSLVADPVSPKMWTEIAFESDVGNPRIEWQGVPSAANPKTSADVPYTVINLLRRLGSTVCYG